LAENFTLDELMTLESPAERWPQLFTVIELRPLHELAISGTFTKDESASSRNAI
jgi:hypothetical protein